MSRADPHVTRRVVIAPIAAVGKIAIAGRLIAISRDLVTLRAGLIAVRAGLVGVGQGLVSVGTRLLAADLRVLTLYRVRTGDAFRSIAPPDVVGETV